MASSTQRSPFDIDIRQITDTYTQASAVNIAKVELPENTRFLWYYSSTKDPIAWMLKGVGDSLILNNSKAEGNGLLNLTVVYPNGVRESVARSLLKQEELEVIAFANEVMLDRSLRAYRIALNDGDDFEFKCVFRGSLTNLKIILPDAMECKDQFFDANAESISVCCTNLRFRKGQYGCEGQSEEKKLLSTIYLYGNAAFSRAKCALIWMTLVPLAVLT
ncbi:unnamed protein product [Taenia asiatica]|uniref:Ig-like domain-containing protein n=1 Tax=Taenia asiatica TaxID=60517 RepID=A0A0R3W2Z3_TAEAS|nr:unnamed protein product [Taenia asiatica]